MKKIIATLALLAATTAPAFADDTALISSEKLSNKEVVMVWTESDHYGQMFNRGSYDCRHNDYTIQVSEVATLTEAKTAGSYDFQTAMPMPDFMPLYALGRQACKQVFGK
jgi:hypothetical protein